MSSRRRVVVAASDGASVEVGGPVEANGAVLAGLANAGRNAGETRQDSGVVGKRARQSPVSAGRRAARTPPARVTWAWAAASAPGKARWRWARSWLASAMRGRSGPCEPGRRHAGSPWLGCRRAPVGGEGVGEDEGVEAASLLPAEPWRERRCLSWLA